MIDVSTLSLDDLRRLYPVVSLYNAESVFATGAKTMGDLWRIQSEMFARLKTEDPHFIERDRFEIEKDLDAVRLGAKGGAAGHGAAKRRDVDYSALGKLGGRPKRSCETCGSHPAYRKGLCVGCQHAIEVHGATRADAHMVTCDRRKCGK